MDAAEVYLAGDSIGQQEDYMSPAVYRPGLFVSCGASPDGAPPFLFAMRPADVLLISVALLAALFFVGGLIDLFNDLRVDSRQRSRRRKRRPVPKVETDSQTESEAPALTSSPAAPPMAADLVWPARRPAPGPPARRQAPRSEERRVGKECRL